MKPSEPQPDDAARPDEPLAEKSPRERARAEAKPMAPLQAMAMGLILIALDSQSRYDLFPDPLGWLLVLWGVMKLPLPERPTLLTATGLALATACVLFVPAAEEAIGEAGLSMIWAVQLPDLAFVVLLCRALIAAARRQKPVDRTVAGRFGVALTAAVVVIALVPIGSAAENDGLITAADGGFVLLWLWLVWNLFAVSGRSWLASRPRPESS
ncbi:hypothetical protein ACLM5J_04800 [Nocardioides sp. Bht2]|uniref:hypothetical protein n=1 Tax=Nocardioides sp. Bht2 TaxID=3392297 RepID=UPI0039B605C6